MFLRDFHIAISHLSAGVIPRQLEYYFRVRDMDLEGMIDRFERRDQAVHKTERPHEVLELERSGELVAGELSIRCRLVLVNWLVCCTSPDVLDECGHHVRLGRVAVSATLPLLV